jgi:hypothetical protein
MANNNIAIVWDDGSVIDIEFPAEIGELFNVTGIIVKHSTKQAVWIE